MVRVFKSKVSNIHLAITFDQFSDLRNRKLKLIKPFLNPMAAQIDVCMILIFTDELCVFAFL